MKKLFSSSKENFKMKSKSESESCFTHTQNANIGTARRVQNSLNGRDAKSDVIPGAYKL